MKKRNNFYGFGDFSSFIFIGIFAVIGSLFIIRIFAASKPTVNLQLVGYAHTNSQGQRDYSGVHGNVTAQDADTCFTAKGDTSWQTFSVKNGANSFDSHPLLTGSTYQYVLTCKNSVGTTVDSQTVTVP